MHKSFQAMLVGAAIQDRAIKYADDTVATYIDEWRGERKGGLTLYQLMTMASNLAQYEMSLNPFSENFKWLYSSDAKPIILKTSIVEPPDVEWHPGEKFDYNNINSELLGLVIQEATGKRYADYLSEKIWMPLGAQDGKVWLDREGGQAHTSCCMMARPRDWAKVGLMLLHKGELNGQPILSPQWVEQMIKPSPASPWYGMQIWLGYEEEALPPMFKEQGFAEDRAI